MQTDTTPESNLGDVSMPKWLKRKDMVLRWDVVPEQTTFGTQRGLYEGIKGTSIFGHLAVIPFGQHSPRHSNSGEHLIIHVSGDIEWSVGDDVFRPEPEDIIFIPAEMSYEYVNKGRTAGFFFAVIGKFIDWPPKGRF